MIKELTIEHIKHKDEQRVFLRFKRDKEAADLINKFFKNKWSATHTAWHIP